jgi:alkylation response protein AidB-like acyl-CoA dehydrogenase
MDFSLTDDQHALLEATRRFLAAEYPRQTRGSPVPAEQDRARWTALAGLGLPAMAFQTRWGGTNAGLVDLALVARELGRCHAGEGMLSSVVLAGLTLQQGADEALCAQWLPRVAEGRARLALAHAEPDARYRSTHVRLRAHAAGSGFELCGTKSLVLDGDRADAWLVLARTRGDTDDLDGLSLFLVPRESPGVTVQRFGMLDGREAAHLHFDRVPVGEGARVGPLHAAAPLLQEALRRGALWTCAESLGAMDSLITETTEHLMTRRQFGAPLSRFQALQHRMADALIALEESEAITFAAALYHDDGAARDLQDRTATAAQFICARAGQRIAETAIQLHGAMGMTEDCRVGHFAKLLWTLGLLFGDVHHHVSRYAGQAGTPATEAAVETAPEATP